MSKLKVLSASAASVVGGGAVGVWWERKQKTRNGPSSNLLDFLPTAHAATAVFLPPGPSDLTTTAPPLPARKGAQMKFGFPTLDQLKFRSDYVLSYDRKNRTAFWVFEHLTESSCTKNDGVERKKCDFRTDHTIHPFFQSTDRDYRNSGFDRGHLAAAGNHRACQEDCQETFFYSNMAPQVGEGFNRGAWNNLERMVRGFARKNPHVYVVTGPLYLPRQEPDGKLYVKYQVIGENQVSVPTHFFKVAVVQLPSGGYDLHSFVLPNQPIPDSVPLTSFYTPLESIERSAGFLLFEKIPRDTFNRINGVQAGRGLSSLPAIGG